MPDPVLEIFVQAPDYGVAVGGNIQILLATAKMAVYHIMDVNFTEGKFSHGCIAKLLLNLNIKPPICNAIWA
jgi:hypothetical protein